MLKCPFCNFHNEDGALFCEQCKSDLGAVVSAASAPAAVPMAVADAVPMAAVIEEPIPMAHIEPAPVAAMGSEPIPALELPSPAPIAIAEVAVASVGAVAAPAPVDVPPPPAVAPPAPAAAPAPATPEGAKLPADAKPRLVVLRGQKINVEFPIYEGLNFIGRADEKPVDIDLEDQEPPERIWCSRQHALISLEEGVLTIEDLNSANHTYVNRAQIYPGQKRVLVVNDVIQIGNVQLKLKV